MSLPVPVPKGMLAQDAPKAKTQQPSPHEKARAALEMTDAHGGRRFSQVRVNPSSGKPEGRPAGEHTKWQAI